MQVRTQVGVPVAAPTRVAGGAGLLALVALAAFMLLSEVALVAQHAAWFALGHPGPAAVIVVAAVLLVAALAAGAVMAYPEVSAWARAVVVLAAVQAAVAIAALVLWLLALADEPMFAQEFPLAATVPMPALIAGALVVLAALVAPATSTTPRWLLGITALALATLVTTSLWLQCYGLVYIDGVVTPDTVRAALVPVLGPALAVAALIAAMVVWRPRWMRAAQWVGGALTAWAVIMAVVLGDRGDELARPWQHLVPQFVPLLLGLAWFATLAVVALAVAHVRSARRVARLRACTSELHGTVVVEAPGNTTVAVLVNRGWLAGLAPACRGFTLRTARGAVMVPAGVDVVVPTPPCADQATTGASIGVLGDGDEVDVVGFEAPAATPDDAYRASAAPVLGTRGVAVVTRRRDDEPVLRDVVLRLWQPCAVLLAACVAAALPAVAGLLL